MEALDLPLRLWMVRGTVLLADPEPLQQILERIGPAFAVRETSCVDHAVIGQCRGRIEPSRGSCRRFVGGVVG